MRKWGVIISAFYAMILLLLIPGIFFLSAESASYLFSQSLFADLVNLYKQWFLWMYFAILLSGQALLLFLSVDVSHKRLKPRAHILVSCIVAAILMALLTISAVTSIDVAIRSNKFSESGALVLTLWGILWMLWGILFYLYFRNATEVTTRAVSWLLKGSVLELLIAIPCHVIVRRRDECSAPVVTSFGIVTGIAIMLLSFGPSVLLLYKKRLDTYPQRVSQF